MRQFLYRTISKTYHGVEKEKCRMYSIRVSQNYLGVVLKPKLLGPTYRASDSRQKPENLHF